jgi:hypothetical protein
LGKHVGFFYNVKFLMKCIVVPFTCLHIHDYTTSITAWAVCHSWKYEWTEKEKLPCLTLGKLCKFRQGNYGAKKFESSTTETIPILNVSVVLDSNF